MVWLQVLGWVGSAVLVWSILQARVLRLRAYGLVASCLLVAYNAFLEVWPMVAMNIAIAGINAYHLVRLLRTRHDEAEYEVVEVSPDDTYLAHLLRRYAEDIARFNPGFRWDASDAAPGRAAFLVLKGAETVGTVLFRDAGDGVAQVELDYVTPRFRDFTPGEFVYRRSGSFAERGFTCIVAPPRMRETDPYLPSIGFRRDGGRWVLDVSRQAEPSG